MRTGAVVPAALTPNPSLERRPREAGRLSSNVRPHMNRICKSSKAQPRLNSQGKRWSSAMPSRGERKAGCSFTPQHITERRRIPCVRSAPFTVARLQPSRSLSFSMANGSRSDTASHSPTPHVSSSTWPRAWLPASSCVAGARPRKYLPLGGPQQVDVPLAPTAPSSYRAA